MILELELERSDLTGFGGWLEDKIIWPVSTKIGLSAAAAPIRWPPGSLGSVEIFNSELGFRHTEYTR